LLVRENVWIGLGLCVFAFSALFGLVWIQATARPLWRDVRARSAEYFGFLGEHLVATEDLRANGATGYVLHRSTAIHRAWLPEAVRARIGFAAMWSTTILLFAGATSLVFGLGSSLFIRGSLTLGTVYLIFHYTEMMRHPIEQIRTQMEDLQKAGAAIERVEELFALRPRLDRSGTALLPAGPLEVSFDRVEFSYEDESGTNNGPALHDVSFAVAPGRVLGVLGRSGSGKTTLARLLTRLYDPARGTVAVGGVPLPAVAEPSLRHRVAMVTQEVRLFRAPVRDNLAFFDAAIGDERIWSALEDLGLADWVRALPAGLDTVLGGDGGLSAGEEQLLSFARVFLEDPGLVVLDEASSRLDPATEVLVERAVDRLLTGRTGIIIAHRLSTVERADDVLILEGGRIAEFGERAGLGADPDSRFSGLLRTGMQEVLR
jgi:ATP-binding cassette subfamily B protein